MRIGVIGTGTIASAVVRGIAGDGHEIVVSERSAARSAALAGAFDNVRVAGNQAVLDASDLVFIGTTAEAAPRALAPLVFRADQLVVSLMAGPDLAEVAAMVAPARAEAVMIPFPLIAQGNSPVLVCPPSQVLDRVVGARNTVIAFDDPADMAPYMAAQAALSPALKLVDTAAGWLAQRSGNAGQAEQFLALLIGGTLQAGPLKAALADLDTPGGLNRELREFLADRGAYDALEDGLAQLERRLAEP